jgi:hypothetical protein
MYTFFSLCYKYSTSNIIAKKNELGMLNMTKLITKRYLNHTTNTVCNTESEKFETQDNMRRG